MSITDNREDQARTAPLPVLTGTRVPHTREAPPEEKRPPETVGTIGLLVSAAGIVLACLPILATALYYSGMVPDAGLYNSVVTIFGPMQPFALLLQVAGCVTGLCSLRSRQGRLALVLPVLIWLGVFSIYYARYLATR